MGEKRTRDRTWKEDGLGGEEISGVVENRQQVEERRKDDDGERERDGSSNFSCLARLRSCKWSVSELDAEISYQEGSRTAHLSQDCGSP